jgi:hypothetical protein
MQGATRTTVEGERMSTVTTTTAAPERAAVLEAAERLVAEYGLKEACRRIGLALDTSPPPSPDELALAMEGNGVIRLILDPSRRRARCFGRRASRRAACTAPS